jgi:hypothetical protein
MLFQLTTLHWTGMQPTLPARAGFDQPRLPSRGDLGSVRDASEERRIGPLAGAPCKKRLNIQSPQLKIRSVLQTCGPSQGCLRSESVGPEVNCGLSALDSANSSARFDARACAVRVRDAARGLQWAVPGRYGTLRNLSNKQRLAFTAQSRPRVLCATPVQKRATLYRSRWFHCCV